MNERIDWKELIWDIYLPARYWRTKLVIGLILIPIFVLVFFISLEYSISYFSFRALLIIIYLLFYTFIMLVYTFNKRKKSQNLYRKIEKDKTNELEDEKWNAYISETKRYEQYQKISLISTAFGVFVSAISFGVIYLILEMFGGLYNLDTEQQFIYGFVPPIVIWCVVSILVYYILYRKQKR